ncbi:MAG: alpha/beta fold hydrolase [Bacteroidota bacterium]
MRVRIGDVEIAYNAAGPPDAPSVIFLHAFPLSKAMWKAQLDALSPFCRAIAFDVRGHGESDPGDGHYLIEFFVDDLISFLDALHIEQTVIVGLSMGGYIALRAIERNPERFRGLVLCDTRSEADTNEKKLSRAASIRLLKTEGVRIFAEGLMKNLLAPETFQSKLEVVQFVEDLICSTSPRTIANTLIALAARTDTTASLSSINVPTLILVGEHDPLSPPAVMQAMQEKIPNSELHIIPKASHLSNLENPEEFNRRLVAFLKRIM